MDGAFEMSTRFLKCFEVDVPVPLDSGDIFIIPRLEVWVTGDWDRSEKVITDMSIDNWGYILKEISICVRDFGGEASNVAAIRNAVYNATVSHLSGCDPSDFEEDTE